MHLQEQQQEAEQQQEVEERDVLEPLQRVTSFRKRATSFRKAGPESQAL